MKAFMFYISWEILVLYLVTGAAYVVFTGLLVVLLWARGETLAAGILAPVVAVSWLGMLGQVAHVAEASADMRRHLRGG